MILLPVQHREKIITLSKENLPRYGFACFHSQGEVTVVDGLWHKTISIAAGIGGANKNQVFKIPGNLLIEISSTDKIVNSESYKVHAERSDVEPIKLLSERAGWNQTKADLKVMMAKSNCGYQLATFNNENKEIPLGSGLSLPVADDMSWIGMILVHPELRRQGIARTIMNACLEQARLIQHKSIIGLDATPQGKQVYDSLGFKDSYKIWRSNISTNLVNQQNADVRIEPLALDSIKEYLKRENNEARFQIVALLDDLPDTFNIMARADGKVSGFVMTRPGRLKPFIGPLIADSDEIATCLLNKALMYWDTQGFTHVFIDVPEYHIGQASIFMNEDDPPVSTKRSQFSIQQIRSFVRMYQLISKLELEKYLQESMNADSKNALHLAVEGYKKTKKFVEKERNEIIPSMFATGGPEMS